MTHTPGPWEVSGNKKTVLDSDKFVVAFCDTNYPIEDDEIIPNARLIAAAPDLLAVAQEMSDAVQKHRVFNFSKDFGSHMVGGGILGRLDKAISKARGET